MNKTTRLIFRAACLSTLAPAMAQAQGYGSIDELIVTAARTPSRVSSPALVLDKQALVERQPVAVADVFRNLPGISMRTNSRGESVVRVRGAEERQTLVFLDGAPLATPWDGRTDLALLPAGLIDNIKVTRGVAPIEYGPNAVAGAIDLVTYVPGAGKSFQAEVQQGSDGLSNINAVGGLGLDNGWSFVAAGSFIDRNAERIADKSSVPFDPSANDERTNTDLSGHSFFAATAYSGDAIFLRASLLRADVERGVAAQGHLDPATSDPRFWRTPQWELTQATLNGTWNASANTDLRFTVWQQWFDQTIDAFTDYSYATLSEREEGQDSTTGGRAVLSTDLERTTFRFVATAQESTHDQKDSATATGDPADLVADPALRYRQQLVTGGVEVDLRFTDTLTSTFGLGVDHAATPLTGDKPEQESLSATNWSAGLRWLPSDDWSIDATLGQRSRFPTPRESYGQALGRFLLNPDLQPERSLLADLSAELNASDELSMNFSLWANRSDDTLSQRVVTVDGVNRRQRYNTNGSFTYGIEATATYAITEQLQAEFAAALQYGDMEPDDDGMRPPLLQRPQEQLSAALDWQANPRLDLRAELMYVGNAYDLEDNGDVAILPSSVSVNLRGFFDLGQVFDQNVQLTTAVNNLTDELVLPQLGLPAPGMSFYFGIRIN